MNKDVLWTIYEIVHRDLTKQLNDEYLDKLIRFRCSCSNTCSCFFGMKYNVSYIGKTYNYRLIGKQHMYVYKKYGHKRCCVSKNY